MMRLRTLWNMATPPHHLVSHLRSGIGGVRQCVFLVLLLLVILLPTLLLFWKSPGITQAAWWPTGGNWEKRQQLAVVNSSGESLASGTPIAVSIDTKTLADTHLVQNDCDDLRVIYHPTTTTAVELDRAIVTPGGGNCASTTATKVYFKLQGDLANAATSTSYYVYYGNTQAPAPANTDNTFDLGAKNALLVCPFDGTTTCVGGETPSTATGAIRYNGTNSALLFNGSASNINFGAPASLDNLPLGDFTVEYWHKYDRMKGFWLFGSYGCTADGFRANVSATGALSFIVSYGTTASTTATSTTMSPDQWTHIAFVYNGTARTTRIFINGVEASYATQTLGVGTYAGDSASFLIGTLACNGSAFQGLLDEFRISNVARYSSNFTPPTTNFVRDASTRLLLHADENGNDPRYSGYAIDDSGYGNNGTLVGATYAAGLVGQEKDTSFTGYYPSSTYASHAGMFVEEGTTNKVTNPSFEHTAYDTNWTVGDGSRAAVNTASPKYRFGSKSANIKGYVEGYGFDYFSDTSYLPALYSATTSKRLAQGFQVSAGMTITTAILPMYKSGSSYTTVSTRVEIQTDSAGLPSGTAVANGVSDPVLLTSVVGAAADVTFTFSTPPLLLQSTQYHLVMIAYTDEAGTVEQSSQDTDSQARWLFDYTTPTYTTGTFASMNEAGTWTANASNDFHFALTTAASKTFTTTINAENTNTHTLSAYVYEASTAVLSSMWGGTVSASIAKLVFNGSVVTPSAYTNMGGGWWRLTYSGATSAEATTYGVEVQPGKIIYVDGVQLEEKAYPTTYTDGTLGTGYAWSGTAHASTSTRTAANVKYASSGNISASAGTISLWVKAPHNPNSNSTTYRNLVSSMTYDGGTGPIFYFNSTNIFFADASNKMTRASKAITWTPNQWHHVVATWDNASTTANVYINSVAGTPVTVTVGALYTDLQLESYSNFTYSDLIKSDLRIYSSALTSTEIIDLYSSGLVSRKDTAQTMVVDRFSGTKGQDPVASWHFDDGYGSTAQDSSIYNNDGTISGATWQEGSMCASGRCLKFDGTDDYVSVKNASSVQLDTAMTLSAWIKPSLLPSNGNYASIFSKYVSDRDRYEMYINGTTDTITLTTTSDVGSVSTSPIMEDQWQHVVAVYDGTNLTMYLNGQGSISVAQTIQGTGGDAAHVAIGSRTGGSALRFNGFIDEVIIYPYARSADQVKVDYLQGVAKLGDSAYDPLSQGLVGYWKMDESATPSIDSSGNGNSGTWAGNTASTTGKFGNGASFDGTGDYIDLGTSSSLDITGNKTISLWTKSSTVSTYGRIFSRMSNAGGYKGYQFILWNDGKTAYSSNGNWVQSTSEIDDGNWHHITVTVENTSIRFFKDGIPDGTASLSSNTTTSINAYIGQSSEGYFTGQLDDLRIYNRALSPAEVRALYDYAPSPIAHWTFDEGTGTSAYDLSGNGNTGTITNATWDHGKFGKALSFDGNGDYVETATSAILPTSSTNFTIEAWVKTRSTTGDGTVFGQFNSSGDTSHYLNVQSTGLPNVDEYQPSGGNTTAVTAINNDNWHHLVFKQEGSIRYIYIDGKQDKSGAAETYTGGAVTKVWIGKRYGVGGNTYDFNGLIDDVRIYNYARTPKQIVSDMNASHPAVGSPVGSAVAHYKFDEGADNTCSGGVNDVCNSGSSGSTLDAVVSGATRSNNGKFGKALDFDGTDDYISVPTNTALNFNDASFSFGGWFNADSVATNGYILAKYTAIATYQLSVASTANKVSFYLRDSDGHNTGYVNSLTSIAANTWYHAFVSVDQVTNVATLYINGKKESTASLTTIENISPSSDLIIGSQTTAASRFNGKLDEIKVYPYALSEDEVRVDYNHGAAVAYGDQAPQDSTSIPDQFSNGLLAHWKMDETSWNGTANEVVDSSGNGKHGVRYGDATTTNGKYGKGGTFDGTTDYVGFGTGPSLSGTTNFSVGGWVKTNSATQQRIITQRNGGFNGEYWLDIRSDGTIEFQIYGNSANQCTSAAISTSAVNNNVWHHVLGIREGNDLHIYIDGVKNGSCSGIARSLDSSIGVYVGYDVRGSAYPFNGQIDDVRVYNRALSPQEVEDLYNYSPPPLAHWSFDEGTGTTSKDLSGNGKTATFLGSSKWDHGKFGKGVWQDGNGDGFSSANLGLNGAYTLEYWEKVDKSNLQYAWNSHAVQQNWPNYGFRFTSYTCSSYNLEHWGGGGIINWSASRSCNNRWEHIALTFDGVNSATLYINGISYGAQAINPPAWDTTFGNAFFTYSNSNNSSTFDDVKIFNYALSPSQIAWEYNHGQPIGWWKLDECSGTTANNSGSLAPTVNGTITIGASGEDTVGNCSTTSTSWGIGASGKVNASLSLDGSDDYIDLGNDALLDLTQYTVSAQFKWSGTDSTQWIVSDWDATGTYTGMSIGRNATTDTLQAIISFAGGGSITINSDETFTDTTSWHQVALTYNSISGGTLYLDGKRVGNGASTNTPRTNNGHFTIGRAGSFNGQYFSGLIDDVRLYNYALTPTQAKTLYAGGTAQYGN